MIVVERHVDLLLGSLLHLKLYVFVDGIKPFRGIKLTPPQSQRCGHSPLVGILDGHIQPAMYGELSISRFGVMFALELTAILTKIIGALTAITNTEACGLSFIHPMTLSQLFSYIQLASAEVDGPLRPARFAGVAVVCVSLAENVQLRFVQ